MTTEFQTLSLDSLRESPENTRCIFDEKKLKELAQSIKTQGIKMPLIVRPGEGSTFEIVAGHRRFRAARLAGLTEAPCNVSDYTDAEARDARLIENLQREDLTPLEEAEAYQQRLAAAAEEGKPLSPRELAAQIGKKEQYVHFRLRLLTAIEPVREALRKERLTLGHALELIRFSPEVQTELLKFCFFDRWNNRRDEVASVSELRRFIAEAVLLDLKKAAFKTEDAELLPEAGACTTCPKRTGNDRMLFGDVKQGDVCSDPVCFGKKVERTIDVTVAALESSGKKAARLSSSYSRTADTPQDALTTAQYNIIHNGKTCEDTVFGVYIDGHDKAKQAKVCTNSKCAVHGYGASQSGSAIQDKEKRAKARAEALVRMRIFQAIFTASSTVDLEDQDYLHVVEFALWRADHNGLMRTAKVVGWDKEMFSYGGRAKLRAQLAKVSFDEAMTVALLASVSSELSVNEYSSTKADRLQALAKSFHVDPAAIRKEVTAEIAAKKKMKRSPKPVTTEALTVKKTKKAK